MEIYTIGFTQHTAAEFFGTLRSAGIQQLIDVRLNNTSQLAGFAKRDDLAFFLRALLGAQYRHEPLLAPTPDILDAYRKKRITWTTYQARFLELMNSRHVEGHLDPALFDLRTVLLCSEKEPKHCHRRLVVRYLAHHWPGVTGVHL